MNKSFIVWLAVLVPFTQGRLTPHLPLWVGDQPPTFLNLSLQRRGAEGAESSIEN